MGKIVWKKTYYNDGQLDHKIPYLNGRRHGLEVWYYPNGELKCEIPWVNGQLHGVEKLYCDRLQYEIIWVRGQQRDDLLGDEHRLTRLMLLGDEG